LWLKRLHLICRSAGWCKGGSPVKKLATLLAPIRIDELRSSGHHEWIVLKNSTMDADGCDGTERLSG